MVLSAGDSATRNEVELVVVISGNVPDCPAPAHVTNQYTVTATTYRPPG